MNLFQKWAIATLVATLFLIFIGGMVRAAGAGLGCPDWPKCWGTWLPPASIDSVDVPAVLTEFQRKDPSLGEEDLLSLFDPFKMWVEYLNRLVGVVIGLLVLGTFILSVPYLKGPSRRPVVFWGALASFLLVGFQGWLGGQVVRSGLKQGMVTLHLFAALVLFCLLIYVTYRASEAQARVDVFPATYRWLRPLIIGFFLCCSLQIVLGAQVREAVDAVSDEGSLARGEWLGQVGLIDHLHRIFAWALLIGAAVLGYAGTARRVTGLARGAAIGIAILVVLQIVLGVALAYAGLPPTAQVLHLGVASGIACLAFYLLIAVREKPQLIA